MERLVLIQKLDWIISHLLDKGNFQQKQLALKYAIVRKNVIEKRRLTKKQKELAEWVSMNVIEK